MAQTEELRNMFKAIAFEDLTQNEEYQRKLDNNALMKNLARISGAVSGFSISEPHTVFEMLSDERIEQIAKYVVATAIAIEEAGYLTQEERNEATQLLERFRED